MAAALSTSEETLSRRNDDVAQAIDEQGFSITEQRELVGPEIVTVEDGGKRKRKISGAQRRAKKTAKMREKDGGKGTCVPDALCMLLQSLSIPVDKEMVRSIMPSDPDKNTRFVAADEYVRQFGFTLQRVTKRFMQKGGVALALLQTSGHFVVQLRITNEKSDGDPDLHCVAYDGKTVRDNYMYSKVKELDEGDTASPEDANDVFNSLVNKGLIVRIKNVYELVREHGEDDEHDPDGHPSRA